MAARNAASVLPDPVGAKIRVERPAWISGQPSDCARVGPGNVSPNHSETAGWNPNAGGRDMTVPDYRGRRAYGVRSARNRHDQGVEGEPGRRFERDGLAGERAVAARVHDRRAPALV